MGDRRASGARIRSLREKAGLSQIELGQRTGIKSSSISNWELGLTYPQYNGIVKLCKAFGCSADELLGLPSDRLTVDERKLLRSYREIDDDGRHTVDAVVESQLRRLNKD